MKIRHTPYHWLLVALVLAALLLTLTELHGQSSGAAAVFEGRPALAGAQGGQGAQAGPPQGGIGVQGSEGAERGLRLRKPPALRDIPPGPSDAGAGVAEAPADMTGRSDVAPARDRSLAKDERSAAAKTKRAAKRTISRAHHGVAPIDSVRSEAQAR